MKSMTTKFYINRASLGFLILSVSTFGVSACATTNSFPETVDAVMLNPEDGPTRNAIRVFVRDMSGPELIVNPDSLVSSPVLTTHKRQQTTLPQNTPRQFRPTGDFRLAIDGARKCWLVHSNQEVVSRVELPASAYCAQYEAP